MAAALVVAVLVAGTLAARPADAAGTVRDRAFHSRALEGTLHFSIFLPAGYAQSTRRYPVVYFLHGLPATPSSYRSGWVARVGDSARRNGRDVIVVGVQGARTGDSDPEWHDWGPGRNWETATARDLVRYVDGHYRTLPMRRARALIGVSAGGYGAAIIGVHHPATFAVIESWSGYFHPTTPDGSQPLAVGDAAADARASLHTYVASLRQTWQRVGATLLRFYVGSQDQFRPENEQFDRELTADRVPHIFREYPGGHSESLWDAHEDSWVGAAVRFLEPAT